MPPRSLPIELEALRPDLTEVIEELGALQRGPGSPGEAQAAEWIATRLRRAGAETVVERAHFYAGYAQLVGSLMAMVVLGSRLAASRRRSIRRLGALSASLGGLAIADDISNGPRVVRRRTPQLPTQNVVGQVGDLAADRTLVVMAHHDAAPTGFIFDDRFQRALADHVPGLLERIDTSLPLWWVALAAPALVVAGAERESAALNRAGTVLAALVTAAMADVARSPIVPGANDNLSAVAVLVGLAERLAAEPLTGLRVLLVSCGAEEVIQGGIHSFAERHFPELPRERTWFLNLDSVASPRLALVEGEGPVVMEDYPDRTFRDLVAHVADRSGAPLRRGMRARNSTDAVIPSRAGYPTATLVSIDRSKAITHYHQLSDTAANADLRTVTHALLVAEAVARELAANPWIGPSS